MFVLHLISILFEGNNLDAIYRDLFPVSLILQV